MSELKVGDVLTIPSRFIINPEPVAVNVTVTDIRQESDSSVVIDYMPSTQEDADKIERLLAEQRTGDETV